MYVDGWRQHEGRKCGMSTDLPSYRLRPFVILFRKNPPGTCIVPSGGNAVLSLFSRAGEAREVVRNNV